MRKVFLLITLLLCNSTFAQNKEGRLVLGIRYGFQPDFNQEIFESGLFMNSFEVQKSDIGVNVGYKIFKSIYGESEVGLSLYNANLYIYPDNRKKHYSSEGISNKNVYISQQFAYKVFTTNIYGENIKLELSPMLRFNCSFSTDKRNIARGYTNLEDKYVDSWIERYDLPMISAMYKTPAAYFSMGLGVDANFVIMQKLALNLFGGYNYGISGHTYVDATYKYYGDIKRNLSFESKDRGFYFGAGLKYYLK